MVWFSHDPIKSKQREKDERDFRKKFKVILSYFCILQISFDSCWSLPWKDVRNCSKNFKYMKLFNSLKGPSEFCTPWWWILMPVWRRVGASTWRWSVKRFSMLYRRPARSMFCVVIARGNVSHTHHLLENICYWSFGFFLQLLKPRALRNKDLL